LAGEVENGVNPTPDLYRVHADIQKTRVKLGLGKEEPLKLPFPAFLAGRGILKSPEVRRKCWKMLGDYLRVIGNQKQRFVD
jgi:hypothetical protein